MKTKKKLILISSQIIDKRNLNRFKLLYLKKKFNFEYWDISQINKKKLIEDIFKLRVNIKIVEFKNIIDFFICFLKLSKNSYILDLGSYNSFFYIILKNIMYLKGINFIFYNTGTYVQVPPKKKFKYLLKKIFTKNYIFYFLKNKFFILLKFIKFYKYSHYFICGKFELDKYKKKNIILSHSLDYNDFLINSSFQKLEKKKYIVYIDQMYIDHPEWDFLQIPNFIDNKFYQNIKIFFELLRKKFRKQIIICAHPKTKKNSPYLKNFDKVIFNKTANYIKYSDFVIAHDSIAINYAVLFKKPLFLLSMPGMEMTNKTESIHLTSKMLGCNFLDLKNYDFKTLEDIKPVSINKYDEFIKNYIKYGGEKINSWKILANSLKY